MWSIYEIIHIWTAVVDESDEWSSQLIFQFKQLERRSLKKIRASTRFEPVTSAIPVRCSTNWAMIWSHTLIGREVNLLSSYLPVRSEMLWNMSQIIHIWTAEWMIIAVKFFFTFTDMSLKKLKNKWIKASDGLKHQPRVSTLSQWLSHLRYHGRWILTKTGKNFFLLFKLRRLR